jgi:hypothetical protein
MPLLFQALLWLYPSGYRHVYREEMLRAPAKPLVYWVALCGSMFDGRPGVPFQCFQQGEFLCVPSFVSPRQRPR